MQNDATGQILRQCSPNAEVEPAQELSNATRMSDTRILNSRTGLPRSRLV